MRILSLNCWGGRVGVSLVDYLRSAQADLLCLQEVVHAPGCPQEWLDYREGGIELPQRANLFQEIVEALPSHVGLFCPAARGDLFDGDRAVATEWGLATFVRRELVVIGQAQGFVHGDYAAGSWGPHPRGRNAHVVRIFDFTTRHAVTVAHMHGLRDPAGKADTAARLVQADRFAALVRAVAGPDEPVIACGDLNVLPGSATFARLGTLGLRDLVTARGETDTRTSLYRKQPRWADYLLVNGRVRVERFEVVAEPEVSDHRPLLLDFTAAHAAAT
ncbi:MAG: endonuclease/exonuclease/phosphatase family protein [Geminicoccaceae bacterium]